MITKKLIKSGINQNIIKLIYDTELTGTVCQIGQHWFYFDTEAENKTPNEYLDKYSTDHLIDAIYDTITDFRPNNAFPIEYAYYESILRCYVHLDLPDIKNNTVIKTGTFYIQDQTDDQTIHFGTCKINMDTKEIFDIKLQNIIDPNEQIVKKEWSPLNFNECFVFDFEDANKNVTLIPAYSKDEYPEKIKSNYWYQY